MVLFTGTPCQVAALYSVLENIETGNLITAEMVCHGVTSKKVFHSYLEHLERKYQNKISGYLFRCKSRGWGLGNFMYDQTYFDGGKNPVTVPCSSSFFIDNYRKNNLTRESCFGCPYARRERCADFTMGDFHGYDRVNLKLDPYKGLSILLVNTQRAERYLTQLSEKMYLEPVSDISQAMSGNGNLCAPPPYGEKWNEIRDAVSKGRIEDAINKFESNAPKEISSRLKQTIPLPLYITLKNIMRRVKKE